MANDNSNDTKAVVATAAAVVVNSKAAEKLASAAEGVVHLGHKLADAIIGPKRIEAVGIANAKAALTTAQTNAEIERIRVETGNYVLANEMRKTVNREAIMVEAQKALPPPDEPVSDEPISKDFLPNVFDKFDGISDPEIQKIIGRLIAGEVVKPGSYSRRTISVLHDLESSDFATFTKACRFLWVIAKTGVPLVFDMADKIYADAGLSFADITHLESLGLINLMTFGGYNLSMKVTGSVVLTYGNKLFFAKIPDNKIIPLGTVKFTAAGLQLAGLTQARIVPGFEDYVIEKYRSMGIEVAAAGKTAA